MLSTPPANGPMTPYSLTQWSRARALNDPDLSPTRPAAGSKSAPTAATTTHAQSIRAALRRADDIYFAACQRDWELYAVGASLARFLDSTRDQTDWFQLGARSQFDKCLAKGKAMSRDQLMRGLALPYDPCDALVGFACQSGRTFTADPSLRNHDFFGFRAPPYSALDDQRLESSMNAHPCFPFSRVEAAQIFSVHAGSDANQTLQADFPGHIQLSVSRLDVSPATQGGVGGIALDAGHVFEPDQIALDFVWIDPDHFLGVMGEPESLSNEQEGVENPWFIQWSQFTSLPTTHPAFSYFSHSQIKRLAQLASSSKASSSTTAAHSSSLDPSLPQRTDSALLSDPNTQSDDPTLDPETHASLRTRCAQYLTVLTAPRSRLRLPLSSLAKVSLVNDGASTRLGRGVLILELSHPTTLSDESAESDWPNAHVWSSSPRLYIFGYFSELYAVLRRLVFLVPAMEGVVYRGDVEEFRNTAYHVRFPYQVTLGEVGVEEWSMEQLEKMNPSQLWTLAEVCGIRKLVPKDADAFTIAEHLVVYGRVSREGWQPTENEEEVGNHAGDKMAQNRHPQGTGHDGGVIRRRLRGKDEPEDQSSEDGDCCAREYEGLIPAAVPADMVETAAAEQALIDGKPETAAVIGEQQRPWSPTKTMMFIVAIALLFRQFVSFLIASTVRKSS